MRAEDAVLHGREPELAAMRRALAEALSGRGGALAIVGGQGSGKTALLDALEPGAARVWRTCGQDSESALPLAALHGLASELVAGLPADRFGRCVAVHRKLAEAGPLLCLVDEADRLDEPSRETLAFAARRLGALPVLMVFACRDTTGLGGIPQLRLPPLAPPAAALLLADTDLAGRASGNPLALTELAAHGEIPRHSRLRAHVRERLRALPAGAKTFVLMAALEERLDTDTVVRAGESAGIDLDVFDSAVEAGLLVLDEDRVRMPDELTRALVRAESGLGERRAVHRLLAAALDPGRDRLRQLRHRLALSGSTETGELTEAATLANEAGDHVAASEAFERAAELAPHRDDKARNLLAAATGSWLAGQPSRTRVLLRRIRPLLDSPELRGWSGLLHGEIELSEGAPAVASQTLQAAAELLAGPHREQAVRALMLAGEAACVAGDEMRYYAIAARAAKLRGPDDAPLIRLVLDHFAGMSASFTGRHAEAAVPLRRVVGLAEVVADPAAKIWGSQAAYTLGDAIKAHDLAVAAATGAAADSSAALVPWALTYVALTDLLLDRHSSAWAAAERGFRTATSARQPNLAAGHLTLLALVAALRGDGPAALPRLATASPEIARRGLGRPGAVSTWASACVDLADDRPEDALDRFRLMAAGAGPVHPGIRVMAAPYYVEAAARCGQHARAVKALEPFEEWANSTGSSARLALAHRCRALLAGESAAAEEHFRTAIELHRESHTALELAKTELFYASRLRRGRRTRAARDLLRDAWKIFQCYDAPQWTVRAAAELRAAGETVRGEGPADPAGLTPQQREIARLVVGGATNREIAAQLFLSHRTVDHHLRNIFARLGVRSRVELAGVLR